MRLEPIAIAGAFLVRPEPHRDVRGLFARTFDAAEFAAAGLEASFPQHSVSYNVRRGTLRGLHYQREPAAEVKLVRCLRGAACDVLVDLRLASPTYRRWVAVDLTVDNRDAVYIPKGVAHGFQTLADDTELLYYISAPHTPALAGGVRWDDPAFGIAWPVQQPILNDRDRAYPDWKPAEAER